tara:strand:+ start:2200 stop:2598 length:399 start_codon:yes stop_codon:yes gene_type:complete
MALSQVKGNNAIFFNGIEINNLADDAISYEIGDSGDVLSANDTIVHLRKNKNTIVSGVTVTIVKGADNVNLLLLANTANTIGVLLVRDDGMGFNGVMQSASITSSGVSNTTNTTDVETYTFTFKGVLSIAVS